MWLRAEILVLIWASSEIECTNHRVGPAFASMLAEGGPYKYGQTVSSPASGEDYLHGQSMLPHARVGVNHPFQDGQPAPSPKAAEVEPAQMSRGTYPMGQRLLQSEESRATAVSATEQEQAIPQSTANTSATAARRLSSPASNSRQFMPMNNQAPAAAAAQFADGYITQHSKIDASGQANLQIKLDLQVLLEKLDRIALIEHALIDLNNRVDHLSSQITNAGTVAIREQIVQLERQLFPILVNQDNKINGILDLCQQTTTNLQSLGQYLSQSLRLISIQAKGVGPSTQCDLTRMETNISVLASSLTSIIEMIRRMNSQLDRSSILEQISKNLGMTDQVLSILQQNAQQGYQCPTSTNPAQLELLVSQQLATIISTVEGLPQVVIESWETLKKSQTNELIPFFIKLLQWSELTAKHLAGLDTTLEANTAEMKQFFAENQKSLTAVKRIVTETTEVVQNSAAAASAAVASASRSLCEGRRKDIPMN